MTLLASLRSLSPMARRLVLMRLAIYLGMQCAYFIGVVGTLTYAFDGGVTENALGIVLLNGCIVAGSFVGGPLLDRVGPRRFFSVVVAALVATSLLYQLFATSVAGVLVGAALLGGSWGLGDLVAKSFPAYLTDDPDELKTMNSAIFTVSNVAVIAGPLIGGFVSSVASPQAVFWLLGVCSIAALAPAAGFRPTRNPRAEKEQARRTRRGDDSLRAGFRAVFGSPALALLFWSCFFSFFGYGAFDPLESLYYRDVLHVGVEWMGWLSSAAGVGGVVGSMLLMRVPTRHVNVRTLLAVLASEGAFALLYVGTPWVGVACVGQVLLGVAFGMLTPLLSTLVQTHAPLASIGRVNAVMGFGNNVAGVAPLLCAPALAEVLGVQGTLVLASLLVLLMPAVIALVRRREIARLVDEEAARGQTESASSGIL
ncbi:MFS transporter [Thermophilibacter sp.]|uniref:MFS transporter n=1 Tax=Thermophilibacter sp. TaxID=2847309 RepID=UPI003A926F19